MLTRSALGLPAKKSFGQRLLLLQDVATSVTARRRSCGVALARQAPSWTNHGSVILSSRSWLSSVSVVHEENQVHNHKQLSQPLYCSSSDTCSTIALTSPSLHKVSRLDFNDAKAAYHFKSNWELVRAYAVFQLCQMPWLVRHAETMLRFSRHVLGNAFTDGFLKTTLYGHFCAGQDEEAIRPVVHKLARANIGGILDYAAESDDARAHAVSNTAASKNRTDTTKQHATTTIIDHQAPLSSEPPPHHLARTYDYESEAQCDRHVQVFLHCIQSVKNVSPNGFAAVKVTALGNPELLVRMSRAIVEAKNLFSKFDLNQDGFISKDEFETAYRYFFNDADEKLKGFLEMADPQNLGKIDYITWSKLLRPQDLPQITKSLRRKGPLSLATPTDEEIELIEAMFARGHRLAEAASHCGTRLLIDAEQTRFQPAIDNLVLELQQKYNAITERDSPLIYNTYQCYLKDAPERLHRDVERSERFDYHFGAKLVRGAYMEGERAYAKARGVESPIHETLADTHNCYNESAKYLLTKSAMPSDTKVEVMFATHNQESIEVATTCMEELGIPSTSSSVYFAQLYGMADNLTFNLGHHGYHVYKYVPYGQVKEVMPYLLRRAQENSAIMSSASHELQMIRNEIARRIMGWKTSAAAMTTSSAATATSDETQPH